RGLDHEVALAEGRIVGAGADKPERRRFVGLRDLAGGDLTAEIAVDGAERAVERCGIDVEDSHIVALERADMGDATSPLSRADPADGLDHVDAFPWPGARGAAATSVAYRARPRARAGP